MGTRWKVKHQSNSPLIELKLKRFATTHLYLMGLDLDSLLLSYDRRASLDCGDINMGLFLLQQLELRPH